MDPPPIDINDILVWLDSELRQNDFKHFKSILQPCEPVVRKRLFKKEYDAKRGQIDAQDALPIELKTKRGRELDIHPPGLVTHLFDKFTTPRLDHTIKDIPQHVLDNARETLISQLRIRAGIFDRDVTKSINALKELESTIARLNVMSPEERKTVFDDVQKVVLLSIITELVKKKKDIGVNADELRALELKIHRGTQTEDEMYKLIHEYIIYSSYSITTSAELLQFIRRELPVLSACMSPYYQGDKDHIDFNIYLPLLERYIAEVLKEYGMVLAGDSRQIAELIMGIIKEHICAFVRIAGDPDICIRPTVLEVTKKFIIEGVRKFLSDYTPPTPDTPPSKRSRIGEGGNHSRIKKYKNRTKYRTKRGTKYRTKSRAKYRTKRGTKYRTNQYKIKNKKTRKVYKY